MLMGSRIVHLHGGTAVKVLAVEPMTSRHGDLHHGASFPALMRWRAMAAILG
jgi:hypothetical protein